MILEMGGPGATGFSARRSTTRRERRSTRWRGSSGSATREGRRSRRRPNREIRRLLVPAGDARGRARHVVQRDQDVRRDHREEPSRRRQRGRGGVVPAGGGRRARRRRRCGRPTRSGRAGSAWRGEWPRTVPCGRRSQNAARKRASLPTCRAGPCAPTTPRWWPPRDGGSWRTWARPPSTPRPTPRSGSRSRADLPERPCSALRQPAESGAAYPGAPSYRWHSTR